MKYLSLLCGILCSGIAARAQCLQGTCSGGAYGVWRSAGNDAGYHYRVGHFSQPGLLEGPGMDVMFHGVENQQEDSEVDFLLLCAQGNPTPEAVLSLFPQTIITGNFRQGELASDGQLYATSLLALPKLDWFKRLANQWMKTAWNAKDSVSVVYTGSFSHLKPTGRGMLQCYQNNDTVTCIADSLLGGDCSDLLLVHTIRGNSDKEIFRGGFKDGLKNGWALIKHRRSDTLYRQLFLYNTALYTQDAATYPADAAGASAFQTADAEYYAPRDAKGLATGYGTMAKKNATGQILYRYTGYLQEGKPLGAGIMYCYRNGYQYGMKAGQFSGEQLTDGKTVLYDANGEFRILSGQRFAEGFYPESGTVWAYKSEEDFRDNLNHPQYTYTGGFTGAGDYSGNGTLEYGNDAVKKGFWVNGTLTSGTAITDRAGLTERTVLTADGIASPVVKTQYDYKLADGRPLPATLQISKLPYQNFCVKCSRCNGTGSCRMAQTVAPTTESETHNEQRYERTSSIDGYWQSVVQVRTTRVTAGYTYYTTARCPDCDGSGLILTTRALPEPQ